MRTTVNIRDDVLRRLQKEAERTGSSLTETLNRVLVQGLDRVAPESPRTRYRARTFSMGHPAAFNVDKALSFAASLEDEETLRKLRMRK
ncbi:MAG: hypothetical protein AB1758_18600 [Candidatus Eremiobacterota bacterium]